MKGRSTTTQLLECVEEWTSILEEKNNVDIIYLDFQKLLIKFQLNDY